MPIVKLAAVYVAQAVFWLWLAWEVERDRPRGGSRFAISLWRLDAKATRWAAWTMLVVSTVLFTIFIVAVVVAHFVRR